MNVVSMLDEQAERLREMIAIYHGKQHISYAELYEQSCKGSNYLKELGLKSGDVALVFVPMSIDLYCILMSLWRLGMTAMFIDPKSDGDTMQNCCDRAHPRCFIGTPTTHILRLYRHTLRSIPIAITTGWLPFMKRWSEQKKFSSKDNLIQCSAETSALITFTSGSTGLPKGTIRTHGFLAAQKSVLEKTLHLVPGNADLATLPIFALINLACGVTTIIPSVSLKRPAEVAAGPILADIKRYHPATAVASPAFFEQLLNDKERKNLSCLHGLFTGGAPVFPGLLKKLSKSLPTTTITAVYGSTEAEPIAELKFSDISETDFVRMAEGEGLLAGKVIDEIECQIIGNSSGKPLGPLSENDFKTKLKKSCEPGEIVVHGEHVLKGYLGGQGDAENKFTVGQNIWHRTGDLGYFDESGRLWLLGRCSAEINDTRGIAYPFALETAARQYSDVGKAAFCQLKECRILVIETTVGHATMKERLEPLIHRFHVDRLIIGKVPLDRRHNAKVDYPALTKSLQTIQ